MTRARALAALLVAIIVCGVLWELPAELKPDSWRRGAAERQIASDDALARLVIALDAMGPAATPALRELAQHPDEETRKRVRELLDQRGR